MKRLVFVHGSVVGAHSTWKEQAPLGERYELVLVERPGFGPGEAVTRVDFERDAELVGSLLRAGDHLVGHSYGGVITLLAGARRALDLASLTVIEPPAMQVALDVPEVAEFAADGARLYERMELDDPEAFLRAFLSAVGSPYDPPSPLPPGVEQGARALRVERGPWEADIPLGQLAAAPFPKLVVSGAHHAAFDAICDRLERDLGAERLVLPGHGHVPQLHRDFNAALADFVDRASRPAHRRCERG